MKTIVFDPAEYEDGDDIERAWQEDIAAANGYSSLEDFEDAGRDSKIAEMEKEDKAL